MGSSALRRRLTAASLAIASTAIAPVHAAPVNHSVGSSGVWLTDPKRISGHFWLHRPGMDEIRAAIRSDCSIQPYDVFVRCGVASDGTMNACKVEEVDANAVGDPMLKQGALQIAASVRLDRTAADFATAPDGTVQLDISDQSYCDEAITIVPVAPRSGR